MSSRGLLKVSCKDNRWRECVGDDFGGMPGNAKPDRADMDAWQNLLAIVDMPAKCAGLCPAGKREAFAAAGLSGSAEPG
jgi:hypothetical protein